MGPKKWIMATGEHDHSRDSVIILAKRLKHYGLPAELVLAEKAFHGFFTQSTVLDGFETKDNADVQLILDKMANAMDFQAPPLDLISLVLVAGLLVYDSKIDLDIYFQN